VDCSPGKRNKTKKKVKPTKHFFASKSNFIFNKCKNFHILTNTRKFCVFSSRFYRCRFQRRKFVSIDSQARVIVAREALLALVVVAAKDKSVEWPRLSCNLTRIRGTPRENRQN
jgi:hypothetical protein